MRNEKCTQMYCFVYTLPAADEVNVEAESPDADAEEEAVEAVDCEATIDLPICQRTEVPHSGV